MEILTQNLSVEQIVADVQSLADAHIVQKPLSGSIKYGTQSYDLSQWLTIKNYAQKHNLKINTISNWIARNTIPKNDFVVLPQLNYLVLMRDVAHK